MLCIGCTIRPAVALADSGGAVTLSSGCCSEGPHIWHKSNSMCREHAHQSLYQWPDLQRCVHADSSGAVASSSGIYGGDPWVWLGGNSCQVNGILGPNGGAITGTSGDGAFAAAGACKSFLLVKSCTG